MSFNPSLGGQALFGLAVNVNRIPNANAAQIAQFFGVSGVQSMDGGSRGAVFEIQGCMVGISAAAVQAAASLLETMADGVARTFIDTTGTSWSNVVYRKEFQWQGPYFLLCDGTGRRGRAYRCILHGLQ